VECDPFCGLLGRSRPSSGPAEVIDPGEPAVAKDGLRGQAGPRRRLPREVHDRPVTAAVTPCGGWEDLAPHDR
jgi:hypothetical protein